MTVISTIEPSSATLDMAITMSSIGVDRNAGSGVGRSWPWYARSSGVMRASSDPFRSTAMSAKTVRYSSVSPVFTSSRRIS